MQKILFLCTGNYYRSRFAEDYFNHHAQLLQLQWKASSKGLSQNMPSPHNPGPVSVHTLDALRKRMIEGKSVDRFPLPVEQADFTEHEKIIALSKKEHLPMLEQRFSAHLSKVEFFEVSDLPIESPVTAIRKIADQVDQLIRHLNRERPVIVPHTTAGK